MGRRERGGRERARTGGNGREREREGERVGGEWERERGREERGRGRRMRERGGTINSECNVALSSTFAELQLLLVGALLYMCGRL